MNIHVFIQTNILCLRRLCVFTKSSAKARQLSSGCGGRRNHPASKRNFGNEYVFGVSRRLYQIKIKYEKAHENVCCVSIQRKPGFINNIKMNAYTVCM